MKRGRIVTNEKLRQVALPTSVCRMFADDAKNRRNLEPTPLMSLNVLPPSLFFQPQIDSKRTPPLNEKQILDVLNRVNTVLRAISQVLNVPLCASVGENARREHLTKTDVQTKKNSVSFQNVVMLITRYVSSPTLMVFLGHWSAE